jgi:hypothetical protein
MKNMIKMRNKQKPRHIIITLLVIFFIISAIGFLGFYLYVQLKTYPALEEPLAQVEENPELEIKKENSLIIIKPKKRNPNQPAIIFYPGGLVNPEAYLHKMAQLSFCLETEIYLIKPPFNAAIFGVNAAAGVIADYRLEQVWVGGHSLGGIAASRFTADKPEQVSGLFLFGSYSDQDLTGFRGPVVSIMGLNDLIINRNNYEAAKSNLPPQAVMVEKAGLNHSAFGNYGLQKDDGQSSLTAEEIIALICETLKSGLKAK